MAISNTVSNIMPAFGSAAQVQQIIGTALSTTGAVANTIPATGTLAQTFRSGRVRIKISAGGGTSPTVLGITVTVTDGTITSLIYSFNPAVAYALSANQALDIMIPFIVDINANKITVTTTLGGTSPTANMDWEAALVP